MIPATGLITHSNLSLHPLHLKDLRKSGLTDETIHAARISSVPPRDISKMLEGHFPKVESVLSFPYLGDGAGKVGIGYGKANEVPEAIRKGTAKAKQAMFDVPLVNGTLPHEVIGRSGAGSVLMKPASTGTGVIAGGPVRAVVEAAGIHDVLTKCLGSNTTINVVRAAISGLQNIENAEMVARRRGKRVEDLV